MHYFSPANVMRLLEVVRGAKTDPQVLATAMAMGKATGKIAVVAGVCHGFIGNRMLSRRQQQANLLMLEGAAPADIDRVLTDFGFPMGPFQMSDLAGLDIGWNAETSKGESVRYRLCEAGLRGQKNGKGFYVYDENRNRTPNPEALAIIDAYAVEKGINRRTIDDQEILERCLFPMANEGARILAEGKAQRASDIDIVWINGYGWPVYRGGPMFWAQNDAGRERIIEVLEKMGIGLEIIDVQTLLPFDRTHLISESLRKTNRILFVDEDVPGGAAAYMYNHVMEEQGGYRLLDVAPRTLTAKDHRPGYGSDGDYFGKPNAQDVIRVVREMMSE
jgi:3-hydroxyacyl-CoA dehydrogenase